jgi:coenzyme PQQ biosynthesis protein PqqD
MSLIDLNSRPALVAHVRLRTDPVSGEPVLLFPEGVMVLNETAHDIVLRCDGRTTVREIITALVAEYEMDEETLRSDALECLAQLSRSNLMELEP